MGKLKFELIIAYYKRPKIVLNALESILKSTYDNWHLTFVDDSGDDSFKESFLNYGFDSSKITYSPILMSDDEKNNIGGSIFGKYVNDAIQNTDADIIILICDDDAIFPDYMENLNKFYTENPDKMWGYCHVEFYNPEIEHYTQSTKTNGDSSLGFSDLNALTIPIIPANKVDSSQVSFRKKAFTEGNVWYPHPYTANLDAHVFHKMVNFWGLCDFTNCYGQYKGWFANQLGARIRKKTGIFIN
jgi:glycosyltransferase involved in cell wall biosynthesis